MRCKWPETWQTLFERYKYVLLVVAAGIVLLLIPSGNQGDQGARSSAEETPAEFELESFEHRLETALSRIVGAGRVTVVLTLKESSRQVPAQDVSVSDAEQSRRTVIVSKGSGTEQPVMLQSIYPKFLGALVVCPGGGDPQVKLQLLEAVRALTGLSSEKISICESE